ncbi:PAS domain-containing protein [Streptomyces phytohabitans]|uniref:PAS domain-containing protein n=1 Tax=Streptomyces phytohabitans TaxID=1150371 RepID=UPI00345BD075
MPGDGAAGDRPGGGGADDELLLAALLDGMDAALCAFDADGVVTHWNREAERILGWTQEEAVGRRGLAGWAVLKADAPDVEGRLFGAMEAPGRQVHEFALLTKDGRRVLVRTQSSGVNGTDGSASGVYCAFSEVHTQIDLERSIALSEALFEDATWGVVLVDADLRPVVVNAHAARSLRAPRAAMLGRPLGELLDQGLEELENALHHVLSQGTPPAPTELWVTLRADRDAGGGGGGAVGAESARDDAEGAARRCWRSGFLRLASPLAEEPVPLGVAWLFQDVTQPKRNEQDVARLRFRDNQLHRAARAAAECEDPMEAATVHLDFALAGFADHALLDLVADPYPHPGADAATSGTPGGATSGAPVTGPGAPAASARLVRAAATPATVPGPCPPVEPDVWHGIPVGYGGSHPAVQALERGGSVRTSIGGVAASALQQGRSGEQGIGDALADWAAARKWPEGTVHGLCVVLRSRGRTLGVATFLRGASRRGFDRVDATYAEDVAVRVAAAVDLAHVLPRA